MLEVRNAQPADADDIRWICEACETTHDRDENASVNRLSLLELNSPLFRSWTFAVHDS